MITVDEALERILQTVEPLDPEPLPLADSHGLFLAADVVSDTDSPPFDKALMDGYAVRSADCTADGAVLTVVEEITAGKVATRDVGPGEAVRIMTGAPIPAGADAVVKVEDARFDAATSRVKVSVARVSAGDHVMHRGTSMRAGETVLSAGEQLRPQQLGALAEMGLAEVPVRRRPRVGILATGDELVPVAHTPGPGQIRNSNETMLAAQVVRTGGVAVPLGIARDNHEDLRAGILTGLQNDVLLLSGGVSAGKLDLVPAELAAAGVREVFHKVRVKPGKPVWFGTCEMPAVPGGATTAGPCSVFGLPGNPVSSMVCFELFARTALRRLMGDPVSRPGTVSARLVHKFAFRGDRPTYHPCRLLHTVDGTMVKVGEWHGSADLRATVECNGMAVFEPGSVKYKAGDPLDVIEW